MAQIITFKNEPQKWLLARRLALMPSKVIINHQAHVKREKQLAKLDAHKSATRQMIKAFIDEKKGIRQKAIEHSLRKHKIRLAVEMISLWTQLAADTNKESEAMLRLSHTIAASITNSALDLQIGDGIDTDCAVKEIISLQLKIPNKYLDYTILKHESSFKKKHHSFTISGHQHENKAQIWLCAVDKSLNLDFHAEDIERVLQQVA